MKIFFSPVGAIFLDLFDTFEEKKALENFLNTFNAYNEKEKQQAEKIINYITQQLNDETLKGRIDFTQYYSMSLRAVAGLFKLIYVELIEIKNAVDLVHADVIFTSANNLMNLLFTRVYGGADRELIIERLRAQRPILASK